jgi:hypothetical protein
MASISESHLLKEAVKLLGQPPIVPNEPSKISLTFFTMLLVKLHKQCVIIDDDCCRKIIENLILRLQTCDSPKMSKKSRKQLTRGGSHSNNEFSAGPNTRRRRVRTTENLIQQARAQMVSDSLKSEAEMRSKLQDMYIEQIKKASTGLTMQEHLSIMIESGAKAMIPAVMVKMFLMFTIDLLIGSINAIGSMAKTGAVQGSDIIGTVATSAVQSVAPLNVIYNLLYTVNKGLVTGSGYIFGNTLGATPPGMVSQQNVTAYIQNVDKATDSFISILMNPNFSTRVSGATFVLCALFCYNIIVFMRKREMVSKGEEAKQIISKISKMDRYQPPVDFTTSDAILNMVPLAAGVSAMAFSGNPQYAMGIAGITNSAIRRGTVGRRMQQLRNRERLELVNQPEQVEPPYPEMRQFEAAIPHYPTRPKQSRQRSPQANSPNSPHNGANSAAANAGPRPKKTSRR